MSALETLKNGAKKAWKTIASYHIGLDAVHLATAKHLSSNENLFLEPPKIERFGNIPQSIKSMYLGAHSVSRQRIMISSRAPLHDSYAIIPDNSLSHADIPADSLVLCRSVPPNHCHKLDGIILFTPNTDDAHPDWRQVARIESIEENTVIASINDQFGNTKTLHVPRSNISSIGVYACPLDRVAKPNTTFYIGL